MKLKISMCCCQFVYIFKVFIIILWSLDLLNNQNNTSNDSTPWLQNLHALRNLHDTNVKHLINIIHQIKYLLFTVMCSRTSHFVGCDVLKIHDATWNLGRTLSMILVVRCTLSFVTNFSWFSSPHGWHKYIIYWLVLTANWISINDLLSKEFVASLVM